MGGTYEPFAKAYRAAIIVIADLALAAVILAAIRLLEHWAHFLWGVDEALFFSVIPVKWLFHATDLVVIIVMGVHIVLDINRTLRAN